MDLTCRTKARINGVEVEYDRCSEIKDDLDNDPAYKELGYTYLGEGVITEVIYLGRTFNPETFAHLVHFWKREKHVETNEEKYKRLHKGKAFARNWDNAPNHTEYENYDQENK